MASWVAANVPTGLWCVAGLGTWGAGAEVAAVGRCSGGMAAEWRDRAL